MDNLIIAKFGSSAIGINGMNIPTIINRIKTFRKNSKVISVFSAPLVIERKKTRSLTDIVLDIGYKSQNGKDVNIYQIRNGYNKIIKLVNKEYKNIIKKTTEVFFSKLEYVLEYTKQKQNFSDIIRAKALAYSGEMLISHIMKYVMISNGISSESISFENWPIITDNNIAYANFLLSESSKQIKHMEKILKNNVITIGGFIGKTIDGAMTTYERGGSDRTAVNLGILLHKKYNTTVSFEKDSSVVSADPKIVHKGLVEIKHLSYNEARLASMFGMKILDSIVIKEVIENRVDMPLIITNMKNPKKSTTITKKINDRNEHPLKIVTGKKNCVILRIKTSRSRKLLKSLSERRYNEYIVLSPFMRNGVEFTRMLFLDGTYVKKNEQYMLSFDPFTSITYNRGVITIIGDEMWRVQHIVTKISHKIGDAGLNILNIDAQEETSRIIIIMDDSNYNIEKAINAIHSVRSTIKFV